MRRGEIGVCMGEEVQEEGKCDPNSNVSEACGLLVSPASLLPSVYY
jgi:hypothetical protein